MESENQRIIFDLPGETTLTEAIFGILKDSGLEESQQEAFEKSVAGKESKLLIIRDAALSLAGDVIPDSHLADILAKHLETTPEIAKKAINGIQEKLLPYVKNVNPDQKPAENNKEKYREELLRKIRGNAPVAPSEDVPATPYDKKVEIKNVEENAKNIQGGKSLTRDIPVAPEPEKPEPPAAPAKSDTYREPIE